MTLSISLTMMITSCDRENTNNNNNIDNLGGTDNPGGANHNYPSTAHVLPNAVTDIDGNSYDAVQIGNQVWMAENLRTTKYADGTTIPVGILQSFTQPSRYNPNNNANNVNSYGYLYNWSAVMNGSSSSDANPSGVQGVCPNGWHVPSEEEWVETINFMRGQSIYSSSNVSWHIAKALAATQGWMSPDEWDAPGNDPSINNASGFSALPAGVYIPEENVDFPGEYHGFYWNYGMTAFFWTSSDSQDPDTHAFYRSIDFDQSSIDGYGGGRIFDKRNGLSVRCVRN